MKNIGALVSAAFRDDLVRLASLLLALKVALFAGIAGFEWANLLPAFGTVLISLSIAFLLEGRFKIFYLILLDFLYSFLFFANALYFRYFNDFLSLYDIAQLHQLYAVREMVIGMIGRESLFMADFIFIPFFFFRREKGVAFKKAEKFISFFVILILGMILIVNPMNYRSLTKINFLGSIYSRHGFVERLGLINYHLIDAYYYFSAKMKKANVSENDMTSVTARQRRRNEKIGTNAFTGKGKGMNVIVLQVESLQNFIIGKKINGREITPSLNGLAEKGLYFSNVFDQTAAGNSSDATLLANTSLYPSRRGAASFLHPRNNFYSLPKILKSRGYTTATLHAYEKNFWNSSVFEKALGFERQFYESDYSVTELLGWGIRGLSDKSFFEQSIDKIRKLSPPFYAFLRTLSTHAPFAHITRDVSDFDTGELEGEIIGYYARAMHYVDSAIGEFLTGLAEMHLDASTIIVIYGDHRARLPSGELLSIGVVDMKEKIKIPLIIYVPGMEPRGRMDVIGGLIDVAPTVCNILDIDTSNGFFLGRDLTNGQKGHVIFRDGSYISEDPAGRKAFFEDQLMISDLILEKDMVSVLKDEGAAVKGELRK